MPTANELTRRSFVRALEARNLSPRTVGTYLEALDALARHTRDTDLCDVDTDMVRDFLADQAATRSPSTASVRYRALVQFFKWAAEDDLRDDNPMSRVRSPLVPEHPVAVLSLDAVARLLAVCDGKGFEERRDAAIVRLFLEPGGPRLSEVAGIRESDVDFDRDGITVTGKGRRSRTIWFGTKTGQALDRYTRVRMRHPKAAGETALWIGTKGPLTPSGITQLLRRRAAQAGIGHLHPHMLRHTAAHEWLNAGGQETDAMRLFGWRSRQMLARYGASAADERAREAAKRLRLGDRY